MGVRIKLLVEKEGIMKEKEGERENKPEERERKRTVFIGTFKRISCF